MKASNIIAGVAIAAMALSAIWAGPSGVSAKERATISFLSPADGAEVKSPFKVKMGAAGIKVVKAGDQTENSGHHHLIINGDFVPAGKIIPADEKHIHFGGGQTETEVTLPPGEHRLTLQFADWAHRSYGEPLSATITVKVVE